MTLPPIPYTGDVQAWEWLPVEYNALSHTAILSGNGYSVGSHTFESCPEGQYGGVAVIGTTADISQGVPDLLSDAFFAGDDVLSVRFSAFFYLPPGDTGFCDGCTGGGVVCEMILGTGEFALFEDTTSVGDPFISSYVVGVDTFPAISFSTISAASSIYPMVTFTVVGAPAPVTPPDPTPVPPPVLVPTFRPCPGTQATVVTGSSDSGVVKA